MGKKQYITLALSLALIAGSALALPAFAAENGAQPAPGTRAGMMRGIRGQGGMKKGVFGTVTAISGNTITITGRQGFGTKAPASTTFTIDATNAKVTKNNVAGTIGSIVVGDTIAVQGAVTGTNVVATNIRDGLMRGPGAKPGDNGQRASSSPAFTGNGQPVVAGAISAISGSSITITNKSNVTYTVDATNAKIVGRPSATMAITDLKVGDNIVVQGTVSGNAITASSIIDQVGPAAGQGANGQPAPKSGFFQGIGQFFGRIFGF